ncbi:MAG: carbohydrate ABC transporter permease [Clostridiales bacterium]|nr:carbohydrate ABC transporter permease [Clostridiales bacterium]
MKKPQHGQDHTVSNKKGYFIFSVIVLIVIAILFIFPLYWIITGSFKTPQAVNARVPVWFPTELTTVQYDKLFQKPAFTWLLNTVIICGFSMLLTCITASMGGYALAKKKFAGRAIIFGMFVCAMALPKQVILIPLLKEMAFLKLHNTLWAVILPTVGWPFGVFLMKQFSENIPGELLEAARIDGAGEVLTFTNIVLPMIKPGIGALAIFTFITTWNDYFLQLIMLNDTKVLSISLGIAKLQSEMSTDYGLIMAGAALGSVPIIAIFLVFQKFFTRGITMGAVKG